MSYRDNIEQLREWMDGLGITEQDVAEINDRVYVIIENAVAMKGGLLKAAEKAMDAANDSYGMIPFDEDGWTCFFCHALTEKQNGGIDHLDTCILKRVRLHLGANHE